MNKIWIIVIFIACNSNSSEDSTTFRNNHLPQSIETDSVVTNLPYSSSNSIEVELFNNIAIRVPVGWTDSFISEANLYVFRADKESFPNSFNPNITIQQVFPKSSVESYINQYMEEVSVSLAEFQLIKFQQTENTDKFQTYYATYSHTVGINKLGGSIVFHTKDSSVYVFTGAGLNNQPGEIIKYMKMYQPIFESITLK